jgi:hypothetical protein
VRFFDRLSTSTADGAQSIIRRVKAPATIPSRNALEIERKRIVLTGVLSAV